MAGKTAKIKGKRITGKQRVARVKNIEVARRYKKKKASKSTEKRLEMMKLSLRVADQKASWKSHKKASKAKSVGKRSSRYKDKDTPKGQWKNKKTGSRLYGPNIYKP